MTEAPRGPDADPPSPFEDVQTYVVFSVDTRGYALPVSAVRHVLPLPRLTRLPTDAPHILGVFHHGGRVLPLWDLHTLFAADGPPPESPSVVVAAHEGHQFGLLVQQVDEVVALDAVEVVPATDEVLAPHVADIVTGWLRVPDRDDDAATSAEGQAGSTSPEGLYALLAAAGRPDRGAAVLALLAPVHLVDIDRLYQIGTGQVRPRTQEAGHGRP